MVCRGFLKSDKTLGTVSLKLSSLETQCTVHESLDVSKLMKTELKPTNTLNLMHQRLPWILQLTTQGNQFLGRAVETIRTCRHCDCGGASMTQSHDGDHITYFTLSQRMPCCFSCSFPASSQSRRILGASSNWNWWRTGG